MTTRSLEMTWITVSDLDASIKFYTEVMGLTLRNHVPEFSWAELEGTGGSALGLAGPMGDLAPGSNAVITVTVESLETASEQMKSQGAELIGDPVEVPGHVRLQDLRDPDGNRLQLVEKLD